MDLTLPWPALPIVAVDTESTGVSDDDRVCEIAAVRFEAFKPVQRFTSLVNPGRPIPAGATAVHGITDEMVKDAPTLAELAVDLFLVCDGAIPAAYNAPFDRGMIHRELTSPECPAFDPAQSWIDVFVIIASARVDKFVRGHGRLKLAAACQRWGVPLEAAHRAAGDAEATGRLLFTLLNADKIRPVSMARLLAHTDRMRLEHEADHARFRQGLQRQAVQQELSGLFTDGDRQGYEIRKVGAGHDCEQGPGLHAPGSDGSRDCGRVANDHANRGGGQGPAVFDTPGAPLDRPRQTADREPEQPPRADPAPGRTSLA